MRNVILIAIIALTIPLGGCEKYELDRQMEKLCKKDGGVTIYEKITLPSDRFDSNGEIIPIRPVHLNPEGVYGPEYRLITLRTTLKEGDPVRGEGRLDRTERRLIRLSDGKLLAVAVRYGRSGGDLIAYAHFSSKSCPPPTREISIESTFVKGE